LQDSLVKLDFYFATTIYMFQSIILIDTLYNANVFSALISIQLILN